MASRKSSLKPSRKPSKTTSHGYRVRVPSYRRKGYTRRTPSGKLIRVKPTTVKGHYAKGQSRRGKRTPKSQRVLPKVGNKLHLRDYGYGIHKSEAQRHRALAKASRESGEGPLAVLRHLNLIRNYQAKASNKAKFASDVKWMSSYYKQSKRGASGARKTTRKPRKTTRKPRRVTRRPTKKSRKTSRR